MNELEKLANGILISHKYHFKRLTIAYLHGGKDSPIFNFERGAILGIEEIVGNSKFLNELIGNGLCFDEDGALFDRRLLNYAGTT